MSKKLNLLIPALCATFACNAQDTIRRKDADGWEFIQVRKEKAVVAEGYLHNKKQAGVWNEYWLNQYPRTVCAYLNGMKHGTCIGLTATGTMSYLENYKNGLLDGPRKIYNTVITAVLEDEFYSEGQKHGFYKYWHGNGKLKEEGRYTHGQRDGLTTMYYESGTKSAEFTYKKGEIDGEAASYFADGKVKDAGYYKKGVQHGHWKEYYINGYLQAEGEYKDGEKEGEWKEYNVLGKYLKTVNYHNGELVR